MERTYKEIKLPITGHEVRVYSYFLRGDRIAIRKIMTDAVEVGTDGKTTKVDTGYTSVMENEEVRRIIKSVKDGDKSIEVTDEYIMSMPENDFSFIREQLPVNKEKNLTTRQSEDTSQKTKKRGE